METSNILNIKHLTPYVFVGEGNTICLRQPSLTDLYVCVSAATISSNLSHHHISCSLSVPPPPYELAIQMPKPTLNSSIHPLAPLDFSSSPHFIPLAISTNDDCLRSWMPSPPPPFTISTSYVSDL